MQIHGLVPSAADPAQETGTTLPPPGVGPDDDPARAAAQARAPSAPSRVSLARNLWLVAIASLSLLGQGERSFVDERFRKYPPLPVTRCTGYEPGRATEAPEPDEPPFDRGKS